MQVFVKASRRAKAHTRQLGIIKKKVYARRPKRDLAIRANGAIMKIDRKIDLELTSGRGGQRRANQLARRRDAVIRFYHKSVYK